MKLKMRSRCTKSELSMPECLHRADSALLQPSSDDLFRKIWKEKCVRKLPRGRHRSKYSIQNILLHQFGFREIALSIVAFGCGGCFTSDRADIPRDYPLLKLLPLVIPLKLRDDGVVCNRNLLVDIPPPVRFLTAVWTRFTTLCWRSTPAVDPGAVYTFTRGHVPTPPPPPCIVIVSASLWFLSARETWSSLSYTWIYWMRYNTPLSSKKRRRATFLQRERLSASLWRSRNAAYFDRYGERAGARGLSSGKPALRHVTEVIVWDDLQARTFVGKVNIKYKLCT
ncbi:hypothetical protein GQ600_3098 [Phytophthora cactorum]|nr:hypothetical protein GQ600_3098 [Phytophthora cactorum]